MKYYNKLYEYQDRDVSKNQVDKQTLQTLIDINKLNYTEFVKKLSEITSDDNIFPKLKNLILGGSRDGEPSDEKFTISDEFDIQVKGLIPTQNEIDRDKSLAFPITFPVEYEKIGVPSDKAKSQISSILKGESVKINNMPIVVYGYEGSTYILDGHHRWSSVHALNKEGKIKAIKLTSTKEITPLRALRAIQMSISVAIGKIPSSKAGSDETNILLPSSNPITQKYLNEKISDGFLEIFRESKNQNDATKETVSNFIMENIKQLQSVKPVEGAPSRVVMPQTDGTDDLKANQDLWKKPLLTGSINVLPTYSPKKQSKSEGQNVKESKRYIKTFESFKKGK